MTENDKITGVVPRFIKRLIISVTRSQRLLHVYMKWMRAINYALVAGIGMFINMAFLHGLVNVLPLAFANLGAIIVAWAWNYTMSLGRFGYIWGFTKQEKEK